MENQDRQSNCGSSHGYDALIAEMRRRITDADLRHEEFRETAIPLVFIGSGLCLLLGILLGILGTMFCNWVAS